MTGVQPGPPAPWTLDMTSVIFEFDLTSGAGDEGRLWWRHNLFALWTLWSSPPTPPPRSAACSVCFRAWTWRRWGGCTSLLFSSRCWRKRTSGASPSVSSWAVASCRRCSAPPLPSAPVCCTLLRYHWSLPRGHTKMGRLKVSQQVCLRWDGDALMFLCLRSSRSSGRSERCSPSWRGASVTAWRRSLSLWWRWPESWRWDTFFTCFLLLLFLFLLLHPFLTVCLCDIIETR